ncbi:MAG: phosphatidate cytidylyltransferase [Thermomicrobiales bacterium]|nr:phosphatidate cytidylyltransferase [Thermomicrobiales bacterium]
MQRRLIGSVVVVAAGLLPAVIGGPVFALLMFGLGAVALQEFVALGRAKAPPAARWCLAAGLALTGVGALLRQPLVLFAAILIGAVVSLVTYLPLTGTPGSAEAWAWGVAGFGYVGLPVFAAVALRQADGQAAAPGWQQLTERLSLGWAPAAAGMAWVLAVVLSTWAGDSAAYLAGRALGRHKLAPLVSPGKTIEGSLGGLLAATVVSAAVFSLSGVLPLWAGALIGLVIGISGQAGDLSESFLKRQAGVKDSGDLIPGHGGMLDRIDALLFAFPAAWLAHGIVAGGALW